METCGYSHSAGGEAVYTGKGKGSGTMRKKVTVVMLAGVLLAIFGSTGWAALPAPTWMPNSPILAGTQVILLWLPVPGAAKYNIYLNDKKIGESTGIQHIFKAPEGAGEFIIRIAGVDASGAEGARSTPGVIRIVTIEPPGGLLSRLSGGKVALRWDKVKGAVIYNVYRSEQKEGDYKLVGSVQAENYTDIDVAKGKLYYYAVSSKDLAGKESKRSNPLMVSLVEDVRVEAVHYKFKAVSAIEEGRVGFLDGKRVTGVTDLKLEKAAGVIWVVIGSKLFRLSKKGEVLGEIGPVEGVEKFMKMDFGPDGNLYLSDLRGGVYSLDRKGSVIWKVDAVKPSLDNNEIWEGLPPQIRNNYGPTGGDVLCLPEEVWVTDQMFGLIYVFDYSGKFKRYIYKYSDANGKEVRFPAIAEMERLADGKLLFTFPLAHYASILGNDLKEKFAIGKVGTGFVGRFIGIHGVAMLGNGNILLTDPGVNSMQVFDGKTGEYLYHIGGEDPREDPAQPGRAYLDFGAVAFAQFLDEQTLVLYTGSEKSILFLKLKKKG